MSQENVEIVRAAIEALNRGDMDAAFKDVAPDIEWDFSRASGPIRGVYRGIASVRRAAEDFVEFWDSQHYEVEDFIEAGDYVVTPFVNRLRGRDGIEVQARAAFLWSIREGIGVGFSYFPGRAEALEAAGLSE